MDNLVQFSALKGESEAIFSNRLEAYQLLKTRYDDAVLESFDERDERGFGVLTNLEDSVSLISQYGTVTTFEQMTVTDIENGVVFCDLFDAMPMYESLILKHQKNNGNCNEEELLVRTYWNSGVFVFVPDGVTFYGKLLFVKDNSVSELCAKRIVVIEQGSGKAHLSLNWQSFGELNNARYVAIEKITIESL